MWTCYTEMHSKSKFWKGLRAGLLSMVLVWVKRVYIISGLPFESSCASRVGQTACSAYFTWVYKCYRLIRSWVRRREFWLVILAYRHFITLGILSLCYIIMHAWYFFLCKIAEATSLQYTLIFFLNITLPVYHFYVSVGFFFFCNSALCIHVPISYWLPEIHAVSEVCHSIDLTN